MNSTEMLIMNCVFSNRNGHNSNANNVFIFTNINWQRCKDNHIRLLSKKVIVIVGALWQFTGIVVFPVNKKSKKIRYGMKTNRCRKYWHFFLMACPLTHYLTSSLALHGFL